MYNVLGDELHCLFECENTRHIRHVLPRYYTFRPNMFKFTSLLSSEEPSFLKNLLNCYIYVILSCLLENIFTHTKKSHCITLMHHCSRFIIYHVILRVKHTLVYMFICMHTDCKSIAV